MCDDPVCSPAPRRIQLRRVKGWRKPAGVVVVSRPSRWGNPYVVGWCCRVECGLHLPAKHWHVYDHRQTACCEACCRRGSYLTREEAAERAVALYRRHLFRQVDLSPLRGRDLACWCKPGDPCHADVLLELANAHGGSP